MAPWVEKRMHIFYKHLVVRTTKFHLNAMPATELLLLQKKKKKHKFENKAFFFEFILIVFPQSY